jgi:5'-nucleotidase (lipoprotein e(P4) family)
MPTRSRRLLALVSLVVFIGVGCRSAHTPAPAANPATPPTASATTAAPVPARPQGAETLDVQWVRRSAEYQALVRQVYRLATSQVELAAKGRSPGTWAVVLDADETIISNLEYQAERARQGLGFSQESWTAWVRKREATPLPGVAEFLSRVRALGGRIAVVTNRLVSECADTDAVFRAHALPYDVMLCKPDKGPSDKNQRFEAVRTGTTPAGLPPLDILAFVGDNINDFPGQSQALRQKGPDAFEEFGTRFFVLPNPMYGSWQ